MPVEVGPNLESPLVNCAQKRARDSVGHDPAGTTNREPTNERSLGFRKRLNRHCRLKVKVSAAVVGTAILIGDEKEGVHVGSECRRGFVRVIDTDPLF